MANKHVVPAPAVMATLQARVYSDPKVAAALLRRHQALYRQALHYDANGHMDTWDYPQYILRNGVPIQIPR